MNGLSLIHEYWVELVFIVGVIINFFRQEQSFKNSISILNDRVCAQDKVLDDVKVELKANNAQFTQLQVDIQAIKTALEYIKTEMARK